MRSSSSRQINASPCSSQSLVIDSAQRGSRTDSPRCLLKRSKRGRDILVPMILYLSNLSIVYHILASRSMQRSGFAKKSSTACLDHQEVILCPRFILKLEQTSIARLKRGLEEDLLKTAFSQTGSKSSQHSGLNLFIAFQMLFFLHLDKCHSLQTTEILLAHREAGLLLLLMLTIMKRSSSIQTLITRYRCRHQDLVSHKSRYCFATIRILCTSNSIKGRRKKLKVERVRELTQCINQGVIGCGDPRVTDKLHAEGIEHWPNLADEFLDLSFSMCAQTLEKSVEVAFKEWRATRLFDMVRSTVQTYLRDTWQSQSNLIGVLWDMESNKVMIGDEEAIKHRKAENYKILKRRWINIRTNELTVGKEAQKGTQKKSLQLTATEKEEIEADARAEPLAWDDELQQIAVRSILTLIMKIFTKLHQTSRAYYYYAANRYADNIGSAIRTACFDNCRNKLCSVLAKELRLNSTENEGNLATDSHMKLQLTCC